MSPSSPAGHPAWRGKTAIVVGASSGIGRHLVEALAQSEAARIVIVARDPDRLQATVLELTQRWPQIAFIACAADATTETGSALLASTVAGLPDRVDLLINAAGLSDRGQLLKLTAERLEELVRANVLSSLRAMQVVVPCMAAGGVIVNIGSLSSHFAPRFLGGYALAKHALRALSQQARLELKEQGLHVMLVAPGPIARNDSGTRYSGLASAADLPPEALGGGGGAKIKGLDPVRLAADILSAAHRRQIELIRPRKARWLIWLMALCPGLGESILRRMTA